MTENIVVKACERSLYDSILSRRLTCSGPQTLETAITYVQKQTTGHEMFDALGRDDKSESGTFSEPMDTSSLSDGRSRSMGRSNRSYSGYKSTSPPGRDNWKRHTTDIDAQVPDHMLGQRMGTTFASSVAGLDICGNLR
jgi:hypothetical protein